MHLFVRGSFFHNKQKIKLKEEEFIEMALTHNAIQNGFTVKKNKNDFSIGINYESIGGIKFDALYSKNRIYLNGSTNFLKIKNEKIISKYSSVQK